MSACRWFVALAVTSLALAPAGGAPPSPRSAGLRASDTSSAAEPVLFERSSYVWPYSSGPVYGSVSPSRWNDAGVLHTQVGSFDLTLALPTLPSALQATKHLRAGASQYFLLQVRPEAFTDGAFDRMKYDIAAKGGVIVGEIPVAAFAVRMTQGAYDAIAGSASVIAIVPYPPAFKISPEIGRTPLPQAEKAASSVYSLELQLFPGESAAVVGKQLKAMGLSVRKAYEGVVFVDADRGLLAQIAHIDQVFAIHEVLPLYLNSEESSTTVQTGRWNNGATPYTDAGVDGGGANKASFTDDQVLMIIDNGIQMDAGDLSNTAIDSGFDTSLTGNVVANHRKVVFLGTTTPFGGSGDLLGCDASTSGGVTHGHTVAVVALGNATDVAGSYGTPWRGVDRNGNAWKLDGVAPKARLIAYDAQITPLTGRCDDPTQIDPVNPTALDVGDLFTAPSTGSLPDAHARGARVVNFSWGSVSSVYDTNASKIDAFANQAGYSDVAIFVAAGNAGRDKNLDGIPDPNTIGSPATAKNIISVGASGVADDLGNPFLPDTRWVNSSNGPATVTSGRIAPLVMAPGTDAGSLGLVGEYHCRSNDNDQAMSPVECDVVSGRVSTSFASAAAAGAGLLVRDYFAQGFYPDGTNANPGNSGDKVATISGALVKAVLVASADWMSLPSSNLPYAPDLTRKFRGNREQGFGRIQLDRALPLQTYAGAVTGLIVGDGGPAPAGLVDSTGMNLNLAVSGTTGTTLNVCDPTQPLTVAIAWTDPSITDAISRDLDLEVVSPSGRTYLGNVFTDDVNDDGIISGSEDCTYAGQSWPVDSAAGAVDTGPWSIPASGPGVSCTSVAAHVDHSNNVEAIFLSPDSRLNGVNDDPATPSVNEAADNQIDAGAWTVTVKAAATNAGPTRFSIAIAGGVCLGSAARVQRVLTSNQLGGDVLTCNDSAVLTIDEVGTGSDPIVGLTAAEIATRLKIEVVDAAGAIYDTECGAGNVTCASSARSLLAADLTAVGSTATTISYQSRKILLTDASTPQSGNGVLDVHDGRAIRVTYQDENGGTPDPNAKRTGTASVSCRPAVSAGAVVYAQPGRDAFTLIKGGCERDARGYFTFGFPDRYMDAGELLSYTIAFQSAELETELQNVSVSLRAVMADANSPADCKPGSAPTAACPDPDRNDNPICPYLTVVDSPKTMGLLPARATITPTFTIQMAASMPAATQKVDMLIGVTAKSAGKGVQTLIAKREVLNADEFSLFYSTDYPLGGAGAVLNYDVNNNEILEAVTSDPRNVLNDYVFETQTYSDMTSTNPVSSIKAPWNFDNDNGGFISGLQNTSRPSNGVVFAQWGEDKNFNGVLDGYCNGDTPPRIPCAQGNPASAGCRRCVNDESIGCFVNADCASVGGVCSAPHGTCDFSLDEDRNPVNGVLDASWSTAGGCGWQTKKGGDATGGVWHTGLIRNNDRITCLATGNDPGDCQSYFAAPDGDLVGDNNWWELLLTPVLHKVNTAIVGGEPQYQVAITDWAWNMLVDLPDANTSVTLEFDTDVDKSAGVDLLNDTAVLNSFGGPHGAIHGGGASSTAGYSMFARISHCVDTDGNGSPDRCGTAAGRLCGSNKSDIDLECTGQQISETRGTCAVAAAQKKCTGNPNLNCGVDADCNRHCSLLLSRSCNAIAGSVSNTCTPATQGTCIDDAATNGTESKGERCVSNVVICNVDADCGANGPCLHPTGNNREGVNNCVFEGQDGGGGVHGARSREPYGLATPPDDDLANGYCGRNDSLNGVDKGVSCSSVLDCTAAGPPYGTVRSCSGLTARACTSNTDCTGFGTCGMNGGVSYLAVCNKPDSGIDEYVQKNGPGRNYGIKFSGGPDMRITELEDFYGDTGTAFRAALGFNTRESDPNTAGVAPGYGVAVDDMVISWKETRLDPDTHDCAGSGECATLETASAVAYAGSSTIDLTVTDRSPYDPVNNKNDCNGNGVFTDGVDDQDCNNNGTLDVTVTLRSDAEPSGEIAVLDQISPGSAVYKGRFPYSTLYNAPGSLFLVQSGTTASTIRASYDDRDDGTGVPCRSSQEPTVQGRIQSSTTVSATTGVVGLASYSVVLSSVCSGATTKPCNSNADCAGGEGTCTTFGPGDNDGFADTNELINLVVAFANKSGVDLNDLTASLGTTSPNIECITRSSIVVGALADKASSNPANYLPFQFKVANVNRASVSDVLQAKFTITMRSSQFDALTRAIDLTLDLDLNATGGSGSANLDESFEAGFGHYTLEFLDANKASLTSSNGFRCQYNDPGGQNSNSSGNSDCFLGFTSDATTGVNDWHIHTTTAAGGANKGRAFAGKQSLHLGVHSLDSSSPARDTTRLKHIMSIRSKASPASELINLPLSGANAELSFAQQVAFVDNATYPGVSPGESLQQGVVEIKPSTPPTAPWIKIYPYSNVYDQQGTDDFPNCMFDPTDDGNNEDSFFDPTDPDRRLGPSSTCYPEFAFVRQGQTDYRKRFDSTDIGLAGDGPGLEGCSNPPTAACLPANTPGAVNNPGTWVRTRFSMAPYAGRQISVRFLSTAIEIGSTAYMDSFFGRPNVTGDDGWYIDDIRWTSGPSGASPLLALPITLSIDAATIGSPLACGACSAITPALAATPSSLGAPGSLVTVSAGNSTANACLSGVLQYQFWNNADENGTVGDLADVLLRDWTDNSAFVDAPLMTTQYAVKVRCSSDTSCDTATNFSILTVSVTCPAVPVTYYHDVDGDGYGNAAAPVTTCLLQPDLVANATDCNDANAGIHPGASDTNCNGVDENCSGAADESYAPQSITCGAGACAGAGSTSCVGGVAQSNCTPLPNGTNCSDGNLCTTADACASGACLGGPSVSCDDGNDCTSDSCSPGTGCLHANVPNGTGCSDGNACTTSDTCAGGVCVGGAPPTCADDGNACTLDTCSPIAGCVHEPGDNVIAVDPPDDTSDVSVSSNVTLTFELPIDPATVTASTFRLVGPGEVVVPAARFVSADGRRPTLDPDAALAPNTIYRVETTSGITCVGSAPTPPFTSYFETGAADETTSISDISQPTNPLAPLAEGGTSVEGCGDLNRDGVPDLCSGAPGLGAGGGLAATSIAQAGAALIYFGSNDASERSQPDVIFEGASAHDRAGVSLAGDFDFNGDGHPDLVIGAEQVDRATNPGNPTPTGNGEAYVIFFDPTDTVHYPHIADPATPDVVSLALVGQPGGIPGIVFSGAAAGDQAGFSVAVGGTFTAGGGTDVVIGAPGADPGGRSGAGAAYVVFDNPSLTGAVSLARVSSGLPDQIPGTAFLGAAAGDELGFSETFAGPLVQGQTVSAGSVVMGAPGASGHAGKVFGCPGDPDTTPIIVDAVGTTHSGFQIVGTQAGEQLGFAVASGGDSIVDGIPDLLIGAPTYDVGSQTDAGRALQTSQTIPSGTYTAGAVGTTVFGVIWTGAGAGDELGYAVAGVGDVTGDGYDDIALGAPFVDPIVKGVPQTDAGAAYVIRGSTGAPPSGTASVNEVGTTIAGTALVGEQAGENTGLSIAGTGDVNGDGRDDLAVGAPAHDGDSGTVYVVLEVQPPPAGECGPSGCQVADLATGAEIDVPAGALASTIIVDAEGILEPAALPAPVPSNKIFLGAAVVTPEGQPVNSPFATIYIPTTQPLTLQHAPSQVLPLFYYNGSGWTPAGIDGVTGANPTYPTRMAVTAIVPVLRVYAVFLSDADGDTIRDDVDNCPNVSNPSQLDTNSDGIGNACQCLSVNCSDGNPCTDDGCMPASGCVHANNSALCDDGTSCTTGDICGGGACSGTLVGGPPETLNFRVLAGKTNYGWDSMPNSPSYDVVRGALNALPVGPGGGDEVCFNDLVSSALVDATTPAPGAGFWYIVRTTNLCATGTFGTRRNGTPRVTTTCP